MATPDEIDEWRRAQAAVFEGWDFAYLKGRSTQDEPPWSYRERAAELMRGARRLLDVDTGGGEFLSSLAPLPSGAKAIESHHPNVAAAAARLRDYGVAVSEVAVGAPWPYPDAAFDLILNRQGHLNAGEIARTLAPGGAFLTQQVASGNLADLAAEFGEAPAPGDNTLPAVTDALRAAGLEVGHAAAWSGRQTFRDVGALVYFLRAIPWVVPGFSVEQRLGVLERLHERLGRDGSLSFSISRFVIEARKPAPA